jgi:hypothetical protein
MSSEADNGANDDYDDDDDGNEAVISFDDGDDDDDEMADLFSFGATSTSTSSTKKVDYSEAMARVMPLPVTTDDDSTHSEDSFIELLEQQKEVTLVDASAVSTATAKRQHNTNNGTNNGNQEDNGNNNNNSNQEDHYDDDEDKNPNSMQEILDWLDEDDHNDEGEIVFVEPPKPPSLEESLLLTNNNNNKSKRPLTPPPPEFDTLEQACKSHLATLDQIRNLMERDNFVVSASVRPHLWCRVVCGKTLEETLQSSVADSFQQWEQHHCTSYDHPSQQNPKIEWIQKESSVLADRIVAVCKGDKDLCQRALAAVLINHYGNGTIQPPHPPKTTTTTVSDEENGNKNKDHDDEEREQDYHDPLLPPVACAILSAGVPKVAAAVMLSHIVPQFMPILALTIPERQQAAYILHRQFYFLTCYHLPLLVLHLDRYLPDWYLWPDNDPNHYDDNGDNGAGTDAGGLLPQSHLLSHLAGECGGALMNPRWLQCLWDLILTSNNNSLRFFLVMSVLETHADQLLILTGVQLQEELQKVLSFQDETTSDDGFAIEPEDDTTSQPATRWVHDWTDKAQALWEDTPISVVRMLKHLEDEAVNEALMRRQQLAEERLQQKLEAEARAHRLAMEVERERKADEARLRLTRARLVAFYRQYNPGKETNIDKIMKTYEGRYDVLDAKLKQKYKIGFNPATKAKPKAVVNTTNTKLISTMNQGVGSRRPQRFGAKQKDEDGDNNAESKTPKQVVVKVAPSEVLPVICWSKEANQAKMEKLKKASKLELTVDKRNALKFYLVDSRPEGNAQDQGRFPTAVSLNPEIMMDPDRLKQQEEIFESLRGSVHICIMGEGYAALPSLYGHKITNGLAEFIKEDDARNSNCALFFLKKGFPFVSVLDGGFAAAHAYLCREGSDVHLRVQNVLTDYNPEVSLFGQFEKVHNSSSREKTQRSLQTFFDSSMTALTKNTLRFETLASELGSGDDRQQKGGGNMVTRFFGNSEESSKESRVKSDQTAEVKNDQAAGAAPAFRNPFARKNQTTTKDPSKKLVGEQSNDDLEVELVDFDKPLDDSSHAAGDQSGASKAAVQRQATNSFSIFNPGSSAGEAADVKASEAKKPVEQPKANPFSGFGAALNNSLKVTTKTAASETSSPTNIARPRNPFARFGMSNLGNAQPAKKADNASAGAVNHFAGLNILRMNTMARMRSGAGEPVEESKPSVNTEDVSDESMSFDQSSPASAPSTSDGQRNAPAEAKLAVPIEENKPSTGSEVVSEESVSFDQPSPAIAASPSDSRQAQAADQGEESTPSNNDEIINAESVSNSEQAASEVAQKGYDTQVNDIKSSAPEVPKLLKR